MFCVDLQHPEGASQAYAARSGILHNELLLVSVSPAKLENYDGCLDFGLLVKLERQPNRQSC